MNMKMEQGPILKSFDKLTQEEAIVLVRQIARTSGSEEEIKKRLIEAGFRGDSVFTSKVPSVDGTPMNILIVKGPEDMISTSFKT